MSVATPTAASPAPAAGSNDQLSGTYAIDASHSRIGFVARHAMVTKVRGSFNDFEGTAHIDGTDPSKSSVQVRIQAASVDTRNADRDNHLRANDFFDMANYPELTFASTAVEVVGEDAYRVTGDLTIKAVTKSVVVDFDYTGSVVDPYNNLRIGLEGSVVVNRKDWGIVWNAPLEAGGILVSEKITLELEISAIKTA